MAATARMEISQELSIDLKASVAEQSSDVSSQGDNDLIVDDVPSPVPSSNQTSGVARLNIYS